MLHSLGVKSGITSLHVHPPPPLEYDNTHIVYRNNAMVEKAVVDEVAPTGTMRQNKWMRMLRAPAGMRDGSYVCIEKVSEEEGVAVILAPCAISDV